MAASRRTFGIVLQQEIAHSVYGIEQATNVEDQFPCLQDEVESLLICHVLEQCPDIYSADATSNVDTIHFVLHLSVCFLHGHTSIFGRPSFASQAFYDVGGRILLRAQPELQELWNMKHSGCHC